jgi:UDP-N-acetylmuramoyl-L-alanyl-D-glutamate--2,6-diaminopimelate ligase
VRLEELIEGLTLPAPANASLEVTGVCHDSRRVEPGDLFVAIPGERFDGRDYALDAVERGAAAVLAPGAAPEGFPTPWIGVDDPRAFLGPLAAEVYGHPDRQLVMAGVTGTNGKTTVVHLLAAMLEAAGKPAARFGTLGHHFGDRHEPSQRTTPEASDLFRLLRRMSDEGAEAAALEVSSHALALGRVVGAAFDLAVFTNLSRDHLDFHPDLEEYFATKRKLFSLLKPGGRAAVNVADPYGRRLAAELPGVVTFGQGGAVDTAGAELDLGGIRARVVTPLGEMRLRSPLLGRFNLENLLAAVAGAVALELPPAAVTAAVEATGPLPGRLEPITTGPPFPVLVDFAHTPAALGTVIDALAELGAERRIVVFGCGGDRDRGKRELMGRAVGERAELPILTTDNPRSEEPLEIIAEVERGLRASGNRAYRIVPDRREAIRRALAVADERSVVLLAGKGHETAQIVGDRRLPFSDREVAREALEERFGAGQGG